MRSALTTPALLIAIALAGCDGNRQDGTSITLNADGGNVAGALDGKSGALKIDVPGFKGQITLPKVKLNAGNFDLNGVHLYPGSTIETVDIAGTDTDTDKGGLRVVFTSPAGADTVRDWFQERLGKAGFTLRGDGTTLIGKDQDGDPFRLDVAANGADGARGTIDLGS